MPGAVLGSENSFLDMSLVPGLVISHLAPWDRAQIQSLLSASLMWVGPALWCPWRDTG